MTDQPARDEMLDFALVAFKDCPNPVVEAHARKLADAFEAEVRAAVVQLPPTNQTTAVSPPAVDRADIGTEFVYQVDHPDEAGLTAFETTLASETGPKAASKPDGRVSLVDRVREVLARSDGFDFESLEPHDYQIQAAAVLAVLPAPADRAAVLREAADAVAALDPVEAALAGQGAWQDAAALLRRMAAEATPEPAERSGCPLCGHRGCMGKGRRCNVTMTSESRVWGPPCQCLGVDAAVAQPDNDETPCGPTPDQCGDEPCANHEREQAHAEGEHCFCGPECGTEEAKTT